MMKPSTFRWTFALAGAALLTVGCLPATPDLNALGWGGAGGLAVLGTLHRLQRRFQRPFVGAYVLPGLLALEFAQDHHAFSYPAAAQATGAMLAAIGLGAMVVYRRTSPPRSE